MGRLGTDVWGSVKILYVETWWNLPAIPALGDLREEGCECEPA